MKERSRIFKSLVFSLLFMGFISGSFAQTNTSIGPLWNVAANWSLNQVPQPGHDVVINTNMTMNMPAGLFTVNSITVNTGRTLTIGNSTTPQSIDVTTFVTTLGTGTITIGAFDAIHSLTIGGTLTNNGTLTLGTSAVRACNVTMNGPTITGNGAYTFNTLVIGAAVANNSTSTINVRGDLTLNNALTCSAGTISFMGAVAQNLNGTSNSTFNNLDLRNTGTAVTIGGTLSSITVSGNLTMNGGGTPSLNLGTSLTTLSIGGSFTMTTAGTTFDFGTSSPKTVNLTGNLVTPQTITMTGADHQLRLGGATNNNPVIFTTTPGSGSIVEYFGAAQTVFASANYRIVRLSGSNVKTFSGATTINSDLNITGTGITVSNAFPLTVTGNLNNSGTGTTTWGGNVNTLTLGGNLLVTNNTIFTIGNTAGQIKTLSVAGNVQVDAGSTLSVGLFNNTHALTIGGTLTNTGTFNMSPAAAQVCNVTMNGLTITGNGAYTFNNLVIGAAVANNSTSTINVRGDLTLNNTLTCSAGVVNFNNNIAQTISGASNATFNDLRFTGGAGAKTWGGAANTFTVNGNLLVNNNTTLTIGNAVGQTKTMTVGNVQVDLGSTINVGLFNNTHDLTIGGTLTNNGTFNMWNSATQLCNVTMNGLTITGNGAYTLNNLVIGAAVANNSTSSINVRGDLTLNNALTCSAGTVSFIGGVAQNLNGTTNPTFNNLDLRNAGTAVTVGGTLTGITVSGTLTMNAAGTPSLNLGTTLTTFTVGGNFTMAGGAPTTFDLGTTVAKTVTITGNLAGTTINMAGAGLAHQLILGGATNTVANAFNTTVGSGSIVEYNNAVTQSVFASPNYRFLRLSGGGTKSFTGATINNDLNITGSGVIVSTNGNAISVAGNLNNTGAGVTTWGGIANILTLTGNLLVTNNTTFTIGNTAGQTKTLNITGNVQVDAGSTMNVGAFVATHSLTLRGNLTNAGTFNMRPVAGQVCNVTMNGGVAQSINGTTNPIFNNLSIATDATYVTLSGITGITVNGTFTMADASTFDFGSGSARIVTVVGDLVTPRTITMTGAGLAHQLILGGAANAAPATFNTTAGSGSIVEYNNAVTQTVFASLNYRFVRLSGGGTKTFSGVTTINNDLNITGSGVIVSNALVFSVTVSGDLNNSGTGVTTWGGAANTMNITGNILVTNNTTFTIGGNPTPGAKTLSVTGNIQVDAGSTMNVGAFSLTHSLTLRGNLTNAGTFNMRPAVFQVCNVTMNGGVAQSINGTTNPIFNNLSIATDATYVTLSGITGITVNGTFTMANASTFDFGSGSARIVTVVGDLVTPQTITMTGAGLAHQLRLGGALNAAPVAFNNTAGSGSIVEYFGAAQTVFPATNYRFVRLSGSGIKTFSAGPSTLENDLDITGSGITVSNANALAINGNLTNSGTGTTTWGGISNTLTLTGNLLVTNNTTFTIGNAQAKTLNVTGNVQVDAGSTMNVGAGNVTHLLTIGGTLTNTGTLNLWTSNNPQVCNVTLNGNSITGNGAYTFNTLIINGAVVNNSTSIINVRGDLTLNNTLTCSAGVVNFNNNIAQTISGASNATFNDLRFTGGAGAKTWGGNSNTFTVNGNLLVNNNTTFTIGNVPGQSKIMTVGNVQVDAGSTINIGAGPSIHSLTIGGTLTNAGILTLGTSATNACNVTMNGSTITGNGAYTFNTLVIGAAVANNSTSTINVRGDLTLNNTLTCSAGAISFMGAVAQNLNGTTNPTFNNLDLRNAGTAVTVGGTLTGITVSGALTMNGGALNLGTTLTSLSVAGAFTTATFGTTFNFGTAVAKTVTIGGNLLTPQTITMTGAGLAHQLILSGATNNNPVTFTTTPGSGSIVEYNAAGAQSVFASLNYIDLKVSGTGTKTIGGATRVAGVLTLTSVLEIGNSNLTLTNDAAAAIAGGPFSATNMIATNGTGYLIKNATSAQALNPIGAGTFYSPMTLTSIAPTTGTYSIRAVPIALNPGYINVYWDFVTSVVGKTITATFQYDPLQLNGASQTISYAPAPYTIVQSPPTSGTSSFGADSFTITGNTTATAGGYWTMGSTQTYYSYQTGNWNTPTTWTSDPSGTVQTGTTIPGYNDNVVILAGRTVTLTGNVTTQNLNVTINSAGFLNMSTFSFTSGLSTLAGQGTLQLASASFPIVATNTFVNAGGGTVEYSNASSFNLPATQIIYNNLTITCAGQTATQLIPILTLNGNLWVRNGTFRINDNTNARRQLTINGSVTVDNGAAITVGNGVTNTFTDPTLVPTSAGGPFIGYYANQSHRVEIFGDFANNGTVNFSNIGFPIYNSFPPTVLGATTGFATVYFRGATNNVLTCNGTTNFYNLVVDKGTDQTFSLTIDPSAYGNFKLLGANNAAADINGATATNPNIKKALWIRNGTLVLQGSTVIPSLAEGTITAALPATSDYFIPANGALVLNGPDVVVLSTADDYQEVNASYGVSGGTGLVNGVIQGGFSSLYVYGKLQISDGYLSTRESGGIITNGGSGQIIINGGDVDVKQFLNATGSTASFQMTAGLFALRGRFQRTPASYAAVANLIDNSASTVNTARALNGTATGFGTFNLNNPGNLFTMSGGNIWVYDVCDAAPPATAPFAFDIKSLAANNNVTGGTVTIIPTAGTVLADETNYRISSTASLSNVVVNQVSGSSVVQLNTGFPLTILSDVTIQSGVFDANAQNITVGGNFNIASGASYIASGASANTTTFNGAGAQTFTINTAAALDLNNLSITKAAGVALNFAGAQQTVNISGNLSLTLATLNDNGNSLFVAGNVFNSGLHTGAGKISLNGTSTQTINGNGVFQNLELNNTNAAAAPVSLLNNTTINGALTLSQDKLFNINTFNLRFNAFASVINFGPLRYMQTAGNSGDGGITKVYSSTAAFVFPVGSGSTSHVGVPNYTPASIGFGVAPTVYGSITVKPVGFAHPNVTTPGRSLSYFWDVSSSGFTLGGATVTHSYTYSPLDVITGPGITENGYVAARFNTATSLWSKGTVSDLDIVGKIIGEPGTGNFLENVSFIDGDYTAGDDNPIDPFGTPRTFYSFATGVWGLAANWTTNPDHVTYTNPGNLIPGATDIVVIGNNHTIRLATPPNLFTPNTDPRSCATLIVKSGSTLDVRFNPASNFGIVQSHPGGNGTIRIAASSTDGSTFANPLGDFSDFNVNLGTTELYSTNPGAGTTYWLRNGVTTYGNLIISPLGGSNIIFPNNDLTIFGNCTTNGQNADSWFCPTWVGAYPLAPTVPVAKTITILGNLNITGGALYWMAPVGGVAQNVIVNGNVTVGTLSAIDVNGGANPRSLTIGGSLINNANGSTAPLGTVARCNFGTIPLIFNGATSASITNTIGTPTTTLGTVTVNKGTSQATTLTLDIAGTLNTPANTWLNLQNGTFRYMRTDPATDFNISPTTSLTIPSTAGLLIDYANANNRNVLIANSAADANDLLLSGKLTVVRGNVYVGPTTSPGNNNDIEYSGNTAAIQVDGGNLFVNGQIRRPTGTTNGALSYIQNGGAVQINGNGGAGAALTRAKLEVLNSGSQFNMSAGTLTILRGSGTTFGDLFLRPSSSSVTGGSIIFSNVISITPQNYSMDATTPLYNLSITGAAGANATLALTTNPLVINNTLTLANNRSFFNSNNRNLTINQDLVNNGVPGSYIFGTNLTTFSGATQNISGSSVTNFYDLTVSPSVSLTVNNNFTVNRNLTIGSGNLLLNAAKVSVLTNGSFVNNGAYTDDALAGGIAMAGSLQQQVSGTGSFNRLEINNTAGALLMNDITLDHDLVMTNGIFNIQSNNLILNTSSNITGAPFSATKMIMTDGVATSLGLTKFFPVIVSTTAFTFPVGVTSKYTPAVYDIAANGSIGYIKVAPVNSNQPTVIDPTKVLDYYFSIASSGITGFDGSLFLNYLSGDVRGTESNYVASWLQLPGTFWSKAAVGPLTDNVDESINQIRYTFPPGTSNLNGDYTAGEDSAIPSQIPTYESNSNGNWSDNTIWTPVGASPPLPPGVGPNGYNVIIKHTVATDVNNCFAYTTVIEGTGRLSVISPTFGHNFGTIDGDPSLGTGTLYLESGNLPAGNFTPFMDCAGDGTIEYGGSGNYSIILNGFSSIPNLTVSGSGTRVLPNFDLTICNKLVIDGPTLDNSVSNRKLTINGTMERYTTGAFLSGTGATATVTFAGAAAQTLGGPLGDFIGTNGFNNLEINNASGLSIGATGNVEVKRNLTLTQGIITTSTSDVLSIQNTSAAAVVPTGGSATSYIDGPLKKQMVNGGTFVFPLGKAAVKGHPFTFTSTSAGTSLFTAEYFTPNPTLTVTAPLVEINRLEYWEVTTTASKTGRVEIGWDSQSDINGTMTQNGIADLQVAEFNSGPSSWVGLTSITSGTNSLGAAQSTGSVSLSTTPKRYTIGSLTVTKPIATLSPTGAVCGIAGIPVTFSSSSAITLTYTVSYNYNGIPQTPIIVAALPFILPTPAPGTYQLTGFTYNNSTVSGVVDPTIVTTYAAPTTSVAGSNQSLCNATSLNLSGNNPTVGTGLWTIVSGTGGWFNTPNATNFNALFGGPPGQTYTLRWTITSGLCTSSSTVVISFPFAPVQPSPFTAAPTSVCQGTSGYVYSVPVVAGATSYIWSYSGTGATIIGSSNSVTVNYSLTATNGNISVQAVNGCGPGTARVVAVTPVTIPVATFSYAGTPYCQNAANPSPTFSGGGVAGTFSSTAGLVFVSTSTGVVNLAASTPGLYTVTNTISSGPCSTVIATSPITVIGYGSWVGGVSSDWFDPSNWICNTIPTASIDVIIPAGAPNMPQISGAGTVCRNLTINNSASLTINGANNLTVNGNWVNNGSFIPNSSTVTFNDTGSISGTSSINFHNVTISGLGNVTAPTTNISLSGSLTNNGTFTPLTGTITFTGPGSSIGGSSVSSFNNVVIDPSGNLTSTAASVNVIGNWTNNGAFSTSTGTITFNGLAAQSISGANSFNALSVNKPSGNVTLAGTASTTVTGNLNLTNGNVISSSTNVLILGSATLTGGSATSYISGPISKTINNASSFTAPLGSVAANRYRPATISNTIGSDTWSFEYFGNNPTSGGYPNGTLNTAALGTVSEFEYWQISRAASTTADVALAFGPGSYNGPNIGVVANLRVAKWNSSFLPSAAWDLPPTTGSFNGHVSGNDISGVVRITEVTDFGPLTFASTDLSSPLPITLSAFSGKAIMDAIELQWTTSSEINNDYFDIEKIINDEQFVSIGKVAGQGTTNKTTKYWFVDESPTTGISYYRLKQTDLDGKFTRSKVISVDYQGSELISISVYPNPATGDRVIATVKGALIGKIASISLTDMNGKTVVSATFTPNQAQNKIEFESSLLAPGLYVVTVAQGIQVAKTKLIVAK